MNRRSDTVDCAVRCLHPEAVQVVQMELLPVEEMERVTELFGLLAEPSRARILQALTLVERLCVCDLAASLRMSESAVSHQLRLLRNCRLVARERVGCVAYYRLSDEHVRHLLGDSVRHALEESLAVSEVPA